jgi:hypothetical protein
MVHVSIDSRSTLVVEVGRSPGSGSGWLVQATIEAAQISSMAPRSTRFVSGVIPQICALRGAAD